MPTAPEITTADTSNQDHMTRLFEAAVGQLGAHYYVPRFQRYDAAERLPLSWNWAASLSTLNWFAYRQLWLAALVYAGSLITTLIVVFGLGRLVFHFSEGVEWGLLLLFTLASFILPGLLGNAILYKDCRTKMEQAVSTTTTVDEACEWLKRRAPNQLRALMLGILNAVVLGLALIAYLQLPSLHKAAQHAEAQGIHSAPAKTPTSVGLIHSNATDPSATHVTITPETEVTTSASEASATAITITPPAPATATAPAAPSAAIPEAPPVATDTAPPPVGTAPPKVTAKAVPKAPPKERASPPVATSPPSAKESAPSTSAESADYYVQAGLFADSNNANNVYAKLQDAGLPAIKQELSTSKGPRTRVRVGPFDTEAKAEQAVERIRALGLEAIISRPGGR